MAARPKRNGDGTVLVMSAIGVSKKSFVVVVSDKHRSGAKQVRSWVSDAGGLL